MIRVVLISDTHGLLRPEAKDYLRGADRIVHAGDICGAHVIEELSALAPLTVVRGNNDRGAWAQSLAEVEWLQLEHVLIHVLHDLSQIDIDPVAAGVHAVVSGHTHKPLIERRDNVLWVNPGSAGPRRFALPISMGELLIDGTKVTARIVTLSPPSTRFA